MNINSRGRDIGLGNLVKSLFKSRYSALMMMMVGGLIAFEFFNYSTTQYSLNDVLGELSFLGVRWSTWLALAFCAIDFGGIARMFTPETGDDEPVTVWYLFGAWVLAAAFNASLTWWGVKVAMATHVSSSQAIIDRTILNDVVPIAIAVMVWIVRILIIGAFSQQGDRWLHERPTNSARPQPLQPQRQQSDFQTTHRPAQPQAGFQTVPPTRQQQSQRPVALGGLSQQASGDEPTYHRPANLSGDRNDSQT
jgi:hypothetical protein